MQVKAQVYRSQRKNDEAHKITLAVMVKTLPKHSAVAKVGKYSSSVVVLNQVHCIYDNVKVKVKT